MRSRLFLGVRIGSEHRGGIKGSGLTMTTLHEKTYCGYVLSSQTSLKDLKQLEEQLLQTLAHLFPEVRFQPPLLFPELLIG